MWSNPLRLLPIRKASPARAAPMSFHPPTWAGVFVACSLCAGGCRRGDHPDRAPPDVSRGEGTRTGPSARALALTARTHRHADGSIDYNAFRSIYGEPNTNLVLNPRSIDVGATTSAATVEVGTDGLVFDGRDAAWLVASDHAGYTLYCGSRCTKPFLRKVVSTSRSGNRVAVQTTNGNVTDIVEAGWLHVEIDRYIEPRRDEIAVLERRRGCDNGPDLQVVPIPPRTLQVPGSEAINGTISLTIVVDIAVTGGERVTEPVSLDALAFTVVASPAIEASTTFHTASSFSQDRELAHVPLHLGSVEVAGIEIAMVDASLQANTHLDTSGPTHVSAWANLGEDVQAGFNWTSVDGMTPILPPPTFAEFQTTRVSGCDLSPASATLDLILTVSAQTCGQPVASVEIDLRAGLALSRSPGPTDPNALVAQTQLATSGTLDLTWPPIPKQSWTITRSIQDFPTLPWRSSNDAGACGD